MKKDLEESRKELLDLQKDKTLMELKNLELEIQIKD
jgi:hypothetical protein